MVPTFGDRLHLDAARHPILEDVLRREGKRVVPVSFTMDRIRRTLLITGPNTGGKTVTMKAAPGYRVSGKFSLDHQRLGIDEFRFETGPDGVIVWVDGVERGPLIGETLASAAATHDHGVDGHAAGAYRQRAPFRDARLSVAGDGPVSG